jgi:hypothetical protein
VSEPVATHRRRAVAFELAAFNIMSRAINNGAQATP